METLVMTEKERFVKELREFADFIEEKEFTVPASQSFYIFCFNEEDFSKNSKLLGSFEKSADTWLNARKRFGKFLTLEVTISREKVCKKVKVGTKIIPAKDEEVVPEHVIPAQPEREEDVFEYQCPESFLNLKK